VSADDKPNVVLHHVNFPTFRARELAEFYERTLGLHEIELPVVSPAGANRTNAQMEGDHGQLHLSQPIPDLLFNRDAAVNPLHRGHVAFRVSDVKAIIERLEAAGVPYAEYGEWTVKGWYQVFFHDPDGNVIEVHEVRGESDGNA
jgi:catechol 2,3-dioxygenase-like lactoylglutathione lyase family enzyme